MVFPVYINNINLIIYNVVCYISTIICHSSNLIENSVRLKLIFTSRYHFFYILHF
ncbi:uncharacterized protein ASCRUDRAFT_109477 [Ascoidea rubescens DSM 1968]|uniref:Uncharacterized protein n=1 Tax=Ascoidea rubescens DSM 1968 TaxID=1344418 RepID=A0A1D2VD32_9ASCO|nr:hypothetical protein ASCRUDRAFT_109477 [Ascoidea rubescens DSM 1968]ODV59546.1 hypothetical protein ASCRUDRAFT_109477 [Ascoidea rubescens DSM 1968]